MNTEYLSMWDASKLCSYSQEYLSLLSRRGLLKAEKKGHKWLTTISWLNEYLADKKPDEVIVSLGKTSQLSEEKRSELSGKSWMMAITLTISFALIVAVVILSQMSNRISELEAKNNAVSRAQANALAGFDSSVLEVKSSATQDVALPR